MGVFSPESFDNDDAMDFVALFVEKGVPILKDTLKKVAKYPLKDYLEVDLGSSAIVCAEILRAKGNGQYRDLPDTVQSWITSHQKWTPSSKIQALTIKALDRVLGENSELTDLWEDGADKLEWRKIVEKLRSDLALIQFPNEWTATWRMYEWYDRVLLGVLLASLIVYGFMVVGGYYYEYKLYVRIAAFGIIMYFAMGRFKEIG